MSSRGQESFKSPRDPIMNALWARLSRYQYHYGFVARYSNLLPHAERFMADLTPEEAKLLKPHLHKFIDLMEGRRKPETDAQRRFVACARGLRVPITNYEIAFVKWLIAKPDLSTISEPKPPQPAPPAKNRSKKKAKAKSKRTMSAAEAKKTSRGRWSAEEIAAHHKKSGFNRRKVVVYQGGAVSPR